MRDSSLLTEMIVMLVMYLLIVIMSIIICVTHKEDDKYHEIKMFTLVTIIASTFTLIVFESLWLCMYLGFAVV